MASLNGRRVAIVAGIRTPFVKAGTAFRKLTAQDLGRMAVQELAQRAELDLKQVDEVVYGAVVPDVRAPNIAREIVLTGGFPHGVSAVSCTYQCATAIKAMTIGATSIMTGNADVVIAGGAECLSNIPILYSRPLSDALVAASKAKSLTGKAKSFANLKPKDLLPVPPALAEPTTGLTMGESAEKMAKENGIPRDEQDRFAHESHVKAAKAWADGKYKDEVLTAWVPPSFEQSISEDNGVRRDSDLAAYTTLKPVFDRKYGTVTAGNASPLTDGASALLIMSDERAKALGYRPLGYLKAWAYAAVDPGWQLLMAPALAVPRALDRAGMKLAEMDLIEMHEAFAAQVLSNIQALESKKFAQEKLGRGEAVGEVRRDILNVNGGSISIGHPFAATGGRMVLTALKELSRRDKQHALLSVCAAGGLGASVILERV
jgi:acetyl-CoA acyltransferase